MCEIMPAMKKPVSNIITYLLTALFILIGSSVRDTLPDNYSKDMLNSLPIYTVWCEQSSPIFASNQEKSFSVNRMVSLTRNLTDNDRRSFINKTYHDHNHLHFNIPLICYKHPVSQHTCDG